eukprot:jgi/Ulvmu1/4730/UM020_0014.1
MRMILFSTEALSANTVETGLFICFLLIFALAAAWYVLNEGLQRPAGERSRFKLYLNCAMVVTSVIPPKLPMELTMAVNNSLIALTPPRHLLHRALPHPLCRPRSRSAALTRPAPSPATTCSCSAWPRSPTPPPAASAAAPTTSPSPTPEATVVMSCCHALMNVEGDLVGDPLEKAAFLASGWQLLGSGAGAECRGPFDGMQCTVRHVQKFHFNSELKRMSVVVRLEGPRGLEKSFVLAKGAPEVMQRLLATSPDGYEAAHSVHAARGGRVIALAIKTLPAMSMSELKAMSREEAEQGLSYLGLAVFHTPLKDGSAPALKMLAESSHQLVMITGDAPLTACFTAAQVHITDRPVLILNCDEPVIIGSTGKAIDPSDEHFSWRSPDESTVEPFQPDRVAVVQLALQYDLCVTGDGLRHCTLAGIDDVVIGCTQVFARVSPDQKEHIIKVHRAAGRTTLMCGDGTNDVGALKAAHVGVALMEPPSDSKIAAARAAAKEHMRKKKEQLQRQLQGLPPEPRKTTDADGNLLPGSQLIAKFEEQGKPVPESMRKWAEWLDKQSDGSSDGQPPLLKPGDASMASPFTVKATDVMPTTDIIKQGRCTLVVTIQMFKILGLLSLCSAYSLSVLYLAGVKLGDIQATFQGFLSAGLFFFVANAKPLATLSPARPHQSVFCLYVMSSLLLQFAVQISFIVYMYRRSYYAMEEGERQHAEAEFQPNLVNTTCFIVQNAMQLITFAVNYIGEPFQTPLLQNSGMITSLRFSSMALTVVASGFAPQIASYVQLVDLPSDIRYELFGGCGIVVLLSIAIERGLREVFPAFTPPRKGYMTFLHLLREKDRKV